MTLNKLDETTYIFEDGFVRCFLLIGKEKAMWIDGGVSGADLITLAKEVTDLPLLLLNTHGDGDHVASNGQFKSFYMHEDDYINCHVKERFPDSTCISIHDGEEMDLGERVLKLIHIPGHTYGSMAIIDVSTRRLIAGDSVQNGHVFMFAKHRSPSSYKASLQKLLKYADQFDTVLASHETPELEKEYITHVLEDWNDVCAGKYTPEIIELHGTKVNSFDCKHCGFYTDL